MNTNNWDDFCDDMAEYAEQAGTEADAEELLIAAWGEMLERRLSDEAFEALSLEDMELVPDDIHARYIAVAERLAEDAREASAEWDREYAQLECDWRMSR